MFGKGNDNKKILIGQVKRKSMNFKNLEKSAELCSNDTKKKVFCGVLIGHVMVFFVPVAYFFLADFFSKEEKVETISVNLIDMSSLEQNNSSSSNSGGQPSDPVLRPPTEPDRPRPKDPVLKPPVDPPKKPVVKPKKPVTPVKPKKVVPKKPVKKPVAKPVKPQEDLQVVSSLPTTKKPTARPTTNNQTTSRSSSSASGAKNYNKAVADRIKRYEGQLAGIVYNHWSPPNKQLLDGRRLEVIIEIEVSPQGIITKRRITKLSGFKPMDDSAMSLLRNLRTLPAPPNEKRKFRISLRPENL